MATTGSAAQWADTFPDDLVPDVLLVIVSSWESFPKPTSDEIEVTITQRFLGVLQHNQELRQLPFLIDREIWLDTPGQQSSRIDLRFIHGYRHSVYLAFECKRLNVTYPSGKRSEAAEYVDQGMTRFITQKYARSLRHGGMIGYIMDGNLDGAVSTIEGVIQQRAKVLSIASTKLQPSSILPKYSVVRETSHTISAGTVLLHHIFLACDAPCGDN